MDCLIPGYSDRKVQMPDFTLKSLLIWSPILQPVILIIGTVISFSIAVAKDDVSIYLPFISETGAYAPEIGIFSITLILGSFIGLSIIFFQYEIIKSHNNSNSYQKINDVSFYIGIISMMGLAGVAAFPMSTVLVMHLLFAAVYFMGSAVYFGCITYISCKNKGSSRLCRLKIILSVSIFILLFLLTILFPIAHERWHEFNQVIPALKVPDHKDFALMFSASLLEWMIVLIIISHTAILLLEFKKYNIVITVSKEKEDIVINGQENEIETEN